MDALLKQKINNSYESEPSSGSGSSLSENNDYLTLEENMHLPYLLNPTVYEKEPQSPRVNFENLKNRKKSPMSTITTPKNTQKQPKSATTPAYISSQESPFHGFTDSPFGKIQRQVFGQRQDGWLQNVETNEPSPPLGQPSKEACVSKIYDTIICEDSCNAVMPLESCDVQDRLSQESSKSLQVGLSDTQKSDLSFNGKIKCLSVDKEDFATTATTCTAAAIFVTIMDDTTNLTTAEEMADTSQLSQTFIRPNYDQSPDLFADDEDDNDDMAETNVENEINIEKSSDQEQNSLRDDIMETSVNRSLNCPTESSFADEQTLDCATNQSCGDSQQMFRENCKRERELLRRVRKCLSGIPPPPSLTAPQLGLIDMVLQRKKEIINFFKSPEKVSTKPGLENSELSQQTSLLKPTHSFEEVKTMPWRDILGVRYHGLNYNLTKASENHEYLSLSVVERFVGTETNSSYRRSPSSAKKRNARLKMLTQSPGNRLSHLAKRRAVFSSAHLATTSLKSTNSLGPQIIIDKKKVKNRRKATPKRKTPASKKKVRKTPSSSARKRLFRCDILKPGPSRETSKRALFQSPAKQLERQLIPPKLQIKPEIANRVEKSKRALFSPDPDEQSNQSTASTVNQPFLESWLKRKRSDCTYDDDDLGSQSSKLLKTSAENLTPRALKIKSQSFCIGAGSGGNFNLTSAKALSSTSTNFASNPNPLSTSSSSLSLKSSSSMNSFQNSTIDKKLQRAQSDVVASATPSLTDNQRKKLLWAVSQALQEKKVTGKHENFKTFAAVLARVVRRIFQEYYQKSSTSNSETMLRLAKKYVFYVISGRTADDVYFQAKAEIDESKRASNNRLSGYINRAEYQEFRKQQEQCSQQSTISSRSFRGSMQSLFSNDSSIDTTFNCQVATNLSSQTTGSQGIWSAEKQTSTSTSTSVKKNSTSKQRPIEINPSSQNNSSSKSNLGGLALRENSAQKNFTGKDQRNVSPYAKNSNHKGPLSNLNESLSAKAKRQISFDS